MTGTERFRSFRIASALIPASAATLGQRFGGSMAEGERSAASFEKAEDVGDRREKATPPVGREPSPISARAVFLADPVVEAGLAYVGRFATCKIHGGHPELACIINGSKDTIGNLSAPLHFESIGSDAGTILESAKVLIK